MGAWPVGVPPPSHSPRRWGTGGSSASVPGRRRGEREASPGSPGWGGGGTRRRRRVGSARSPSGGGGRDGLGRAAGASPAPPGWRWRGLPRSNLKKKKGQKLEFGAFLPLRSSRESRGVSGGGAFAPPLKEGEGSRQTELAPGRQECCSWKAARPCSESIPPPPGAYGALSPVLGLGSWRQWEVWGLLKQRRRSLAAVLAESSYPWCRDGECSSGCLSVSSQAKGDPRSMCLLSLETTF